MAAVALGSGSSLAQESKIETFSWPQQTLTKAVIKNASGRIHIAPALGKNISVAAHKTAWSSRCSLSAELKGTKLVVIVDDRQALADHECRVNLSVSLPETQSLDVVGHSGDVKIVEARGKVDVKVASGEIDVRGELEALRALTQSGQVKLQGRARSAEMRTSSGDIQIALKQGDALSDIAAVTESGDVTVELPKSSQVKASTVTGNGFVVNRFQTSDTADFRVRAKSAEGNIRIDHAN